MINTVKPFLIGLLLNETWYYDCIPLNFSGRNPYCIDKNYGKWILIFHLFNDIEKWSTLGAVLFHNNVWPLLGPQNEIKYKLWHQDSLLIEVAG